jgi:transcription-repair coupling factor (superfamily II helicase)
VNTSELLRQYAGDERLISIASRLNPSILPGDPAQQGIPGTPSLREGTGHSLHIQLQGLKGASAAIVAAAFHSMVSRSFLIVLNDKEEAAYFQNDLQHFIEKKEVIFLDDSFRKPGYYDELHNSHIQLRTEALNRIVNSPLKNEIVVTYPEALMEKVVNTKALKKSTILIRMNEKLDEDFVIEVLVSYGFERVDFVYEPGQFAIRGGIVDIFSFGNDLPYRIELSGNEVESIRIFDPLSQLSQRKISQVTIVPNIQTQFKNDEKVELFEILPPGTILWFYDVKFVHERITSLYENAMEAWKVVASLPVKKSNIDESTVLNPDEFFTIPALLTQDDPIDSASAIRSFPVVEFRKAIFFSC